MTSTSRLAGATQPRRRAVLGLVVVPLAVILSACGSTALRGGAPVTGGPGVVSGSPGAPVGGSTGGSTSGFGTSGATGATTGASGGATGAVAVGSSGGATGASGATTGGGASSGGTAGNSRPIRLGVVGTDVGAIFAAFGSEAIAWDTSPRLIVAWINKNGGVGGRQLNAIYATGDGAADANTNGQKVCQELTQDNKVDIVVNAGLLGEVLPACLKQAGVAVIDALDWAPDEVAARQYPNWIQPSAIRLDRSISAIMNNAASRGVLKSGAKLGMIIESCPVAGRVRDKVVIPLAKKYGVSVVEGTHKCVDNILADIAPVQNDVQRETLRFNQAGVTHVIIVSQVEHFVLAQFTQQASQQQFHPKYLVSSNAYAYSNSRSDATIKIQRDAVKNILGVGTRPQFDVGPLAKKPDSPGQKASRDRCGKADPDKRGSAGNELAEGQFYIMCDSFFAMTAILEANGTRFGINDVAAGWASVLRAATPSAVLVKGAWAGTGSGRLDGAGYVRPFAWDDAIEGFKYIAGPYLAP